MCLCQPRQPCVWSKAQLGAFQRLNSYLTRVISMLGARATYALNILAILQTAIYLLDIPEHPAEIAWTGERSVLGMFDVAQSELIFQDFTLMVQLCDALCIFAMSNLTNNQVASHSALMQSLCKPSVGLRLTSKVMLLIACHGVTEVGWRLCAMTAHGWWSLRRCLRRRPRCGAHVPSGGGSDSIEVGRKQAHQGEISSSIRRQALRWVFKASTARSVPTASNLLPNILTPPARYAALSETRVVLDAVLNCERNTMHHRSGLHPMNIVQPPR